MSSGDVIELDALRLAAGARRDQAAHLLALRERRRTLEEQVDTLERELRRQAVAHEGLCQAQRAAAQQLDARRGECARLRERVAQRMTHARDLAGEFEALKHEILDLDRARARAEAEIGLVEAEIRRQAESRHRLAHECRESAADLAQLRRTLGQVVEEVRSVLSDRMGDRD